MKLFLLTATLAGNNFFYKLWEGSGFANTGWENVLMILTGIVVIILAIRFNYKPLLLIPMGIGIILGNIPFFHDAPYTVGIYEEGSVLHYLFFGVLKGIYPALIFLGLGAMTDLSPLISNPRLLFLGMAAPVGIFLTFLGSMAFGFPLPEAAAISIIGGADGNTAIFLTSQVASGLKMQPEALNVQNLIGPIAIAAYFYIALVPVIQPLVTRVLTTRKERLIRMKPPRPVTRFEKIFFPLLGLLLTAFVAPAALPLLGMFFFGNILKESGLTRQLANTASTVLVDIVLILIGITVGASTQADVFLKPATLVIFIVGLLSFIFATAGGVLFAKLMNLFLKKENRINPLIGAAGVAALPDSAQLAHETGLKADPSNHLIGHAMAPNIAGVIASAMTAGLLLSFIL